MNSVSFLGLTAFRGENSVSSSQPIICVTKRTHRVCRKTHRVCPQTQWGSVSSLTSETVLSKQHSARFLNRGWGSLLHENARKFENGSKGPKIEIFQDLEIFKRDWNFQASHPPTPIFVGEFWRSRLKISSEIEIFKRDWKFQSRLKFFKIWALRGGRQKRGKRGKCGGLALRWLASHLGMLGSSALEKAQGTKH